MIKEQLEQTAFAKINLYLHITGRAPNGYHSLSMGVAFLTIGDKLRINEAPDFYLTGEGPFFHHVPSDQGNLALKAAHALAAYAGASRKAHIHLCKDLPVASGLGGGSADAATTLLLLNQLWGLNYSLETLADIGLGLGTDVPLCLYRQPAFVSGIGERIYPMAFFPALSIVLVNPGVEVLTAKVYETYRHFGGPFSREVVFPSFHDVTSLVAALHDTRNDLVEAALVHTPVIATVLERLGKSQGCLFARLSGSGATCYGIFRDEASAAQAAREIHAQEPEWWVRACQTLTSHC